MKKLLLLILTTALFCSCKKKYTYYEICLSGEQFPGTIEAYCDYEANNKASVSLRSMRAIAERQFYMGLGYDFPIKYKLLDENGYNIADKKYFYTDSATLRKRQKEFLKEHPQADLMKDLFKILKNQ